MTDEQSVTQASRAGRPSSIIQMLLLFLMLAVMAGIQGYILGTREASGPGNESPDVGFARDMMTHHAQAVEMATLVWDRTEDPEIRQLALDIMLTQQAQIGQMQGWLTVWGYPLARIDPSMSWMGMPSTGSMPGMATPEQMNQLRDLKGSEADGLFLQLMISHHRGGVDMAEAALERAKEPEVRALAQSIVDAQTSEISLMQDLLQEQGLPPVHEEGKMDHSTGIP